VAKIARGRKNLADDPVGHGTHVAGSVLGDGSASSGQYKGIAPKASLFFQSLLDSNGDLGGLPLDLNDLFLEAYQGGARIHNNSWGRTRPPRTRSTARRWTSLFEIIRICSLSSQPATPVLARIQRKRLSDLSIGFLLDRRHPARMP
jgi:hypothetical protein